MAVKVAVQWRVRNETFENEKKNVLKPFYYSLVLDKDPSLN